MTPTLDTLWQQAESEYPEHFVTLSVIADAMEGEGDPDAEGVRWLVAEAKMPQKSGDQYDWWELTPLAEAEPDELPLSPHPLVAPDDVRQRWEKWWAPHDDLRAAYLAAARDLREQGVTSTAGTARPQT